MDCHFQRDDLDGLDPVSQGGELDSLLLKDKSSECKYKHLIIIKSLSLLGGHFGCIFDCIQVLLLSDNLFRI